MNPPLTHQPVMERIRLPRAGRIAIMLVLLSLSLLIGALFVPWVQTAAGTGSIIAYRPDTQQQNIQAMVAGRIAKWYVRDGQYVQAGDPIADIMDMDPNFVERLRLERDAARKSLQAARIAAETAKLDYLRQQDLYRSGLSARKEMEKAQISFSSWEAKQAEAAGKLAMAETKLSRQQTQHVLAPRNGRILRVNPAGENVTVVKAGDILATFVPEQQEPMVELYIRGLDAPLVYPGRDVRLQFEGWPAIQFSGWPSISAGTFAGEVLAVDPSLSNNGKFRVLIHPKPGEHWPDEHYLRLGTRVQGWILLDTVALGYELWRQLNGFPPENNLSTASDNPTAAKPKASKTNGKDATP